MTVSIIHINDRNLKKTQIVLPESIRNLDLYLTSVYWLKNEDKQDLMVLWTYRRQNITVITTCSMANQYRCDELLTFSSYPLKLNEMNTILHTNNLNVNFLRRPRPDSVVGLYFQISLFGWKVESVTIIRLIYFLINKLACRTNIATL